MLSVKACKLWLYTFLDTPDSLYQNKTLLPEESTRIVSSTGNPLGISFAVTFSTNFVHHPQKPLPN